MRPFLDSCPGLAESAKETYLRHVSNVRRRHVESSADEIEVIETYNENSSVRNPDDGSCVTGVKPDVEGVTGDYGVVWIVIDSF